jgi:hypothetical protein
MSHSAIVTMTLTMNDGRQFQIGKSSPDKLYLHPQDTQYIDDVESGLGILKTTVDGVEHLAGIAILSKSVPLRYFEIAR